MEKRSPLHIFVVENDKLFVRLLDYVFSKNILYRFLDFKSGEDALRNLSLRPELIILDYSLPGMNGYETLLEMKEQHPGAHIIMLLKEDDKRLPAEFLNAGAADYVLKDGNEENAIIDKIETFFSKEKVFREIQKFQKKSFTRRNFFVALFILVLVSLGFYYYI